MGGGRDERSLEIGDRGQATVLFTLGFDGIGCGSLLDSVLSTLLKK